VPGGIGRDEVPRHLSGEVGRRLERLQDLARDGLQRPAVDQGRSQAFHL
jgi:hypothetical protein